MPTHTWTELSGIKPKLGQPVYSDEPAFSPLDAIASIWSHRNCWPHICRCCKRNDYVLTFIPPQINTTALGWFVSPVIYHPHKLRISNICSSLSPPANPYSIMIYIAVCDLMPDSPNMLWIGSSLVQEMTCRLFGAKSLPEPMMAYFKLDPQEKPQWKWAGYFFNLSTKWI